MIVTYVECKRCRKKGCYVEENRGQGVIRNRQRWYEYSKGREKKTVHGQKNWKAQKKRKRKKGTSGKHSKILREV